VYTLENAPVRRLVRCAVTSVTSKIRDLALAVAAISLVGHGGMAQASGAASVPGLGTVTFPISTAVPGAASAFAQGVLLLHLFEYPAAASAFREAERLDPSLAMAYWGEAMTFTHPVWNEQDFDAGRAALSKLAPSAAALATKAPTARERGYLAAVDVLYGNGPKASRDSLYSVAMGRLSHDFPMDDEARLFYALSLLGLNQGVRDVPTYLRAGAIAESVFARQPSNPGASHYLIHALDDPDHAALGLAAARALARSSPAADHAQHMTSHIFMALGMWDGVVRANEIAMKVVNAMLARRHREPLYCGHYNVWLDYGLVEQGRLADAARLLQQCREQAANTQSTDGGQDVNRYSFLTMWSQYVLSSGSCDDSVAAWQIDPGRDLGPRLVYWFTRGFCAAHRRDLGGARAARSEFATVVQETAAWIAAADEPSPDLTELRRAHALQAELDGMIAALDDKTEVEFADLRLAAVIEDSMAYAFGPPLVAQPSHELLGDESLHLKRFADARTQFRASLKRTPSRTIALLGLARAAAALGDTADAVRTYRQLTTIWRDADGRVRGLVEAREYLRRHGGSLSDAVLDSSGRRPESVSGAR
jgi:tetratricopeptide (TPR) repeat protein